MGLCQIFHLRSESPDAMRAFLRDLASSASLDERAPDFFVFFLLSGKPAFTLISFASSSAPGRLLENDIIWLCVYIL